MYYIADSDKSFEQACISLESAVTRNDFSVLHVHDLRRSARYSKSVTRNMLQTSCLRICV